MDFDMRFYSREYIQEFLDLYRSHPCIWNKRIKDYKDKTKKDTAYAELVEKLREVEPKADKISVARKINNIRSRYRRETKKIKQSVDDGDKDIYKPKWWYFDFLYSFLESKDIEECSQHNVEEQEENAQDSLLPEDYPQWELELQTYYEEIECRDNVEPDSSTLPEISSATQKRKRSESLE